MAGSETQIRQALSAAMTAVNARLDLLGSVNVGIGSEITLVIEALGSTVVMLLELSSEAICTTVNVILTQAPE